jgi:hypothetical protein
VAGSWKRAPRRKCAAPGLPYEPWLIERLKTPAEAAAYLDAVLEEGDQAAIMLALRQVAQAQDCVAMIGAKRSSLARRFTRCSPSPAIQNCGV